MALHRTVMLRHEGIGNLRQFIIRSRLVLHDERNAMAGWERGYGYREQIVHADTGISSLNRRKKLVFRLCLTHCPTRARRREPPFLVKRWATVRFLKSAPFVDNSIFLILT